MRAHRRNACSHGNCPWPVFARSGAWLRGWGCAAGLTLWRRALCAHFAAMLVPGERRRTRFVRCAHAAQTAAASMSTKHAARASPGPALLAATEIAPPHSPSRKARGVGARSAHRALTHRRCLSGSEAQRNGSEFRRCDRPLSNARQSPQATAIVKRQSQRTQALAASAKALRFQ